MPINFDGGRQWPLTGKVNVSYLDILGESGVALPFENLPAGAQIVDINVNVLTAFNSATSDVIVVGDADSANLYRASVSIATTGIKAGTPTGKKYLVPTQLSLTWTGTGAAPTQGEFEVIFAYVMDGRANEVVPKRKSQ